MRQAFRRFCTAPEKFLPLPGWAFVRTICRLDKPDILDAINNPEYIPRRRAIAFGEQLPSPFETELNKKIWHKFTNYGISMAKSIEKILLNKSWITQGKFNTLNVLVGLAHETEICEYLLSTGRAKLEESSQSFAKPTSLEKVYRQN